MRRRRFSAWLLMKLKGLLDARHDEIARTLSPEHGKTCREAWLEVQRGIENIEVACGVSNEPRASFVAGHSV